MKILALCLCSLASTFSTGSFYTDVHKSIGTNGSLTEYDNQYQNDLESLSKISYYVWFDPDPISSNMDILKYVTRIKPNTSLWRIMKKASRTQRGFRFRYIQYPYGKYVTNIGGVREDLSKNLHWMLYKLSQQPDTQHPPNSFHMHPQGVDFIRVKPGEVYLFWRNHATH
ncbi:unnamed protein product [Allacma fusca]|uniref:Uncharacterized protein n=1 Tax=Allacma fusca TaxID=39272 RepID=A0A8J2NPB0_9HEXA|nr:unnamed protein product [Allacma fusca]